MLFVYTWTIPNKQTEVSCIANDIDEARRKAIQIVKELEEVSNYSENLLKKRAELYKEMVSAPESEDEEKTSTFSQRSKKAIHHHIMDINHQIEHFTEKTLHANLDLGWTSFNTFITDDLNLPNVIIKTEPKVATFYPVTIKRTGLSI